MTAPEAAFQTSQRDPINESALDGAFVGIAERGLRALLDYAAKCDPGDPSWPDRDRLVLSPAAADHANTEGVDVATAQAGGTLATAVGLAMAERLLAARFGRSLVDHRTWALTDPGDLLSGLGHEAASLAGAWRLDRLTALCMTGPCQAGADDTARRLAAQGWAVKSANECEEGSLEAALSFAQRARKPALILCTATDGMRFLRASDAVQPRRAASQRRVWLKRLARHPKRMAFLGAWQGRGPDGWRDALSTLRLALDGEATAARVFAWLLSVPELTCFAAGNAASPREGGLDCGLRVQGMAKALLGLTLHGGLTPCGIVPLASADLLRPALRACATAGRRTLAILLDDESLPDDEHLAGLRAVPYLLVMRPGDTAEALACFDRALRGAASAYAIVLPSRLDAGGAANASRGGHVVVEATGRRALTLVATGAQRAIAMAAHAALTAEGHAVAVVSLPCWEIFAAQDEAYRAHTLGAAPRIGIEAGSGFGWERWLGRGGRFAGASLPAVLELAGRLAH